VSTVPASILESAAPWSGTAYVHVEQRDNGDELDVEGLSRQPNGRWNRPEDSTLYLAGDPGVALSELARHLPADERGATRDLLRIELRVERLVDVRSPLVCERLGVDGAPFCLLDRAHAEGIATRLRATGDVQAILVPPMAFLEQPDRWNLVGFVDRMGDEWLCAWDRIGTLEVRPLE
jgi:RES domain-containing protein